MTIKRSLILSHVSMCILPFFMTFFVLVSSFAGLYLYAKSGNHVMAESVFQFQVMSQVVRTSIFHNIRHGENPMENHWVLDIMDPIQSYVVLYKDGKAVMQYGNDTYQKWWMISSGRRYSRSWMREASMERTAQRVWGSILLWSGAWSEGMCTISICCLKSR